MVNYTISVPDGTSYTNNDPSGNLQWQQFLISSNSSDVADAYHTGPLPAGVYQLHLNGMDLQNLNAWRFFAPVLGVCDTGVPCVPTPGTSSIGDFVWNDLNGNGIQDAGEPGIPNVTVTLLGSDATTVVAVTTTNASGAYNFINLAPGTYYVQFTAPSGDTFTTQYAAGSTTSTDSNANVSTGKTDAVTLASGATDNTIDAGLYQPVSIGDFVWNDLNDNGIQDTGEPGIWA